VTSGGKVNRVITKKTLSLNEGHTNKKGGVEKTEFRLPCLRRTCNDKWYVAGNQNSGWGGVMPKAKREKGEMNRQECVGKSAG